MKATFNDLQDYSSPLDGATVQTCDELLALLESVRDRLPFVCELEASNGYKLTMGIARDVGYVQHGKANGDVPYLMAVPPAIAKLSLQEKLKLDNQDVEFLCGGTASAISKRYILTFDMLKHVAAYFLETGKRSPAVSWEEI